MKIKPNSYYKNHWNDNYAILKTEDDCVYNLGSYSGKYGIFYRRVEKYLIMPIKGWQETIDSGRHMGKLEEVSEKEVFLVML